MKKMISLFLALTACMALCVAPASAAECNSEMDDESIVCIQTYAATAENASAVASVDLSDGDYDIDMTVRSESTKKTPYFKTNTTKIFLVVYSEPTASYTVELEDSDGGSTQVSTQTIYGPTGNYTYFKFPNLTSSKIYRLVITNNSQRDCRLCGSVKDSYLFL